jgi:hypothetical protein
MRAPESNREASGPSVRARKRVTVARKVHLENLYGKPYQGFESLSLRQNLRVGDIYTDSNFSERGQR